MPGQLTACSQDGRGGEGGRKEQAKADKRARTRAGEGEKGERDELLAGTTAPHLTHPHQRLSSLAM